MIGTVWICSLCPNCSVSSHYGLLPWNPYDLANARLPFRGDCESSTLPNSQINKNIRKSQPNPQFACPMIIIIVLIAAWGLPYLWKYVFSCTLMHTEQPSVSQLVGVAFTPILLSVFTVFMGTGWTSDVIITCVVLFIFIISTLTWGYALYHREVAPGWLWLLLAFLTFCLYVGLLFLILVGSSDSWNLNF